jgi:4-amino-4-deoxy-L-arabinose transferase-like glycosyltransferase
LKADAGRQGNLLGWFGASCNDANSCVLRPLKDSPRGILDKVAVPPESRAAFLELNSSKSLKRQIPSIRSACLIRAIVLGLLFLVAFALRVHNIKNFPLEFHPVRQYRSAFIARYFYYQHAKSIPQWKKNLAYLLRQRAGTLEPPFLEYIASLAYRIIGRERVWIPRLFSSIFWLIGGAFLYLLSRKAVSADAALFSIAFYLFAPFGVMASRSFQPDPLMVMVFVISLHAIFLYYEERSTQRLVITTVVSALAILIKPVCFFAILAAFVSVSLSEQGFLATIKNLRAWTFGLAAILPSLMFYGYGSLTGGYIRFQAESSFRPRLYLEPSYWRGWLHMIGAAVGILAFGMALFSIPLFHKGLARSLACGLWVGYFIFGLVFNYHIHTHSYYQLQLIPIVAFALAAGAAHFIKLLERSVGPSGRAHVTLAGVLLSVCLVAIAVWVRANWESTYYEDRDQVTISQQIGERTAHTQRAIFLSYANGELLEYHGELIGIPWPWRSEMHARQGWARPNLTIEERFKEINQKYPSDYFIVTEMGEYQAQHELADFLVKHFPLLVRDRQYLIFDLRSNAGRHITRATPVNSPVFDDSAERILNLPFVRLGIRNRVDVAVQNKGWTFACAF